MGTSTPFSGGNNSNPLLPSWLQGGSTGTSDSNGPASDDDGASGAAAPGKTLPPQDAPTSNFTPGRRAFNDLCRSDGADGTKLAKAISNYVSRAAGGSKTAARRMASDRRAAYHLAAFLSTASQTSVREALETVNLGELADKPIEQIYTDIVDLVCEPGGDLDEAYTRDAFLETMNEILIGDEAELEKPSAEKVGEILEAFVSRAITNRILNAIGNSVIVLPDDVRTTRSIEKQMDQFIRGAVSDAFSSLGKTLHPHVTQAAIDDVFERSLSILQTFADAQAED